MSHLARVLTIMTLAVPSTAIAQERTATPAPGTSCASSPSADTTVYDLTQVSEPPHIRHIDPPRLSKKIVEGGRELHVMLELVVNANGTVDTNSVRVAEPTNTALDPAVVVAKKATFWPGCRFEDAVRVRVRFPVHYAGAIIITR